MSGKPPSLEDLMKTLTPEKQFQGQKLATLGQAFQLAMLAKPRMIPGIKFTALQAVLDDIHLKSGLVVSVCPDPRESVEFIVIAYLPEKS